MSKITYLREVEIRFKKTKGRNLEKYADAPARIYKLFKHLENETKEKFIAIAVDQKSKILCFEVVAIGSVNLIHLRPVEAFRTAVVTNAVSVVMVHNHPSGDPNPSKDDIAITKCLFQKACSLGFEFLDHIIIGSDGYYFSFHENNMLNFPTEKEEGKLEGIEIGKAQGEKEGLIDTIQKHQRILGLSIEAADALKNKTLDDLRAQNALLEKEIEGKIKH